MKKLTALLSAIVLGLTAAPATAFAESSVEPIAPEIQMGDVDGDGVIDALDATLTLRYYTLMRSNADIADIPYYDNIVKYGDINGDGVIDCSDSSVILRKYTEFLSTNTEGDVNLDGVVDPYDAALIMEYYVLWSTFTDEQIKSGEYEQIFWSTGYEWKKLVKEYGDVNGNGSVDVADGSIILNRYMYRTGKSDDEVMEEFSKTLEEVKTKYQTN